MKPVIAQELGFDAGFGPDTPAEAAVAYVEGHEPGLSTGGRRREKADLTAGFTYKFRDAEIGSLCTTIARQLIDWASKRTSSGVERAHLRIEMESQRDSNTALYPRLRDEYAALTSGEIREWYLTGKPVSHTRPVTEKEAGYIRSLGERRQDRDPQVPGNTQRAQRICPVRNRLSRDGRLPHKPERGLGAGV